MKQIPNSIQWDLNKMSHFINSANKEKGFYDKKKEIGTLLMLITSELGEALEADRKNRWAKNHEVLLEDLDFKQDIKDTFEDEIADALIRILDLCGYLDIDIDFHVKSKLEYNLSRPHRHGKAY